MISCCARAFDALRARQPKNVRILFGFMVMIDCGFARLNLRWFLSGVEPSPLDHSGSIKAKFMAKHFKAHHAVS
jgi:hypothetical protein